MRLIVSKAETTELVVFYYIWDVVRLEMEAPSTTPLGCPHD